MKKFLFGLTIFTAMNSSADNIYCQGKVLGVYISSTSDVIIKGDWRNDWTRICNLKSDPSVDVVTCSLWASYAANALQNNITVVLNYTAGPATCNLLPTYASTPTPGYLMLTK